MDWEGQQLDQDDIVDDMFGGPAADEEETLKDVAQQLLAMEGVLSEEQLRNAAAALGVMLPPDGEQGIEGIKAALRAHIEQM